MTFVSFVYAWQKKSLRPTSQNLAQEKQESAGAKMRVENVYSRSIYFSLSLVLVFLSSVL